MGGFSPVHWIFFLLLCAAFIYPVWRILDRIGLPGPLAILSIVPVVNVILLWVVAFIAWPRDNAPQG